jgi:S-DNA-T family DNA segregation ATPase FtsK/SpoIIIE
VRTYLADHPDAEKILHAARRHREAAGTLSGLAAGEETKRETRDALADVRSVFVAGEKGLHWQTIAARLADRHPEHYADTTPEAVSALLRAHVRSVDVKVAGTVLKGTRLDAIETAIAARPGADKTG